jgi:YHS domain-containing protein
VPGLEELVQAHGRYTYHFADEESLALFRAEPERWGIRWGGGCGRMGPLSGVGDPDRWTVHAGGLYIFASDSCREGFLSAPELFVPAPVDHAPPSQEAQDSGRSWIERAVQAHGGAAAIDGSDALQLVFEGVQSGWTQHLEQLLLRNGDFMRQSTWMPPDPEGDSFETRWVLARESFVAEDDELFPVTSPDQLLDLRRLAQREPLALLWARNDEGILVSHVGSGQLADQAVEDVLVLHSGLATTLHLDPDSGRLRGISWRGRPGDGMTRAVVEVFTDWREVSGVLLPVARRVLVDGEESSSMAASWDEVELLAQAPRGALERERVSRGK